MVSRSVIRVCSQRESAWEDGSRLSKGHLTGEGTANEGMTIAPHFHVGILVEDLDEATRRFSTVLGITFRSPVTAHLEYFADPVPRPLDPRFTYSYEGPPYLELVEMTDSSLHSPHQGEGLHHIGVWLPDPKRAIAEMERQGVRREASIQNPDGSTLVWFNDGASLHGTRIEFIDEGMRLEWEGTYGATR